MNSDFINNIIKNRRSVFPFQYNDSDVSNEIIQNLLNNANMAPTHRLTQPWRFKVLQKKAKNKLGDFLSKLYCLLYTSPSPRDSDSSRMPSSA